MLKEEKPVTTKAGFHIKENQKSNRLSVSKSTWQPSHILNNDNGVVRNIASKDLITKS